MRRETHAEAMNRLNEWSLAFHVECEREAESLAESRAEGAWLRYAERPDFADRDEYPVR
jgi:hypothetical protein